MVDDVPKPSLVRRADTIVVDGGDDDDAVVSDNTDRRINSVLLLDVIGAVDVIVEIELCYFYCGNGKCTYT